MNRILSALLSLFAVHTFACETRTPTQSDNAPALHEAATSAPIQTSTTEVQGSEKAAEKAATSAPIQTSTTEVQGSEKAAEKAATNANNKISYIDCVRKCDIQQQICFQTNNGQKGGFSPGGDCVRLHRKCMSECQ